MPIKNHILFTVNPDRVSDIKTLGKIIQRERKRMKLSQADLAGICAVGIRFLSELENGKKTVELTKVLQVLHGLGFELILKKRGWH